MQQIKHYKVCLIGGAGCGKSTWLRRVGTDEYSEGYLPTLGVEVYPITLKVKGSKGSVKEVCFNVWDCAGNPKFKGLCDGYYQAFISFYNNEVSDIDHVKFTKGFSVIKVNSKVDKRGYICKLKDNILLSTKSCKDLYKLFKVLVKLLLGPDFKLHMP